MLECDTVSHCGPTLQGEFARTLTMKEMRGDRHEHGLDRVRLHPGNASKWILEAVEELREKDIAFTRSRPYRKNDHSTACSKNNRVFRKHAFYWRYDTTEERELLNRLWRLVSLRMNLFTPTKKPIGYDQTAGGRRRRIYDQPKTPWRRVKCSGVPVDIESIETRIAGINPADLTREFTAIQQQLTHLAAEKTRALIQTGRLDMASLEKPIERLQPSK